MKRVAITGLGIISPIGNKVEDFWSSLINGECGIGPITRFNTADFKVKIAAEVKGFDPSQFGIDVGAAKRLDQYSQYALAAAQEAVEDSGILGKVDEDRLGVYVGSGIGGIDTFEKEVVKLNSRGPSRVSPLCIPMMIGNMAAGNIAIRFKAKGSCMAIVTACATSTHAIGEAYRAIAHGYADAILAGGTEAAVSPVAVAGFTSSMALSDTNNPEASSLPFDKRRKGFVMGEGSGIIVLEEMEHAKARGAKIYAEVVGYGSTCDAYHITAPSPEGEGAAKALRQALKEAAYSAEDRLYINAHGTGTPLNDATETLAIKLALGEETARLTPISSIKGATGHMLGAAGAAECIACVLALQNHLLPPTLHLEEADPACDLDYVPGKARPYDANLALSTSLGFGGHNGVIALRSVQ